MKFERPIMNISMFDMESIAVTDSTNLQAANTQADTQINSIMNDGNDGTMAAKISVTF